MNLGSAGEDSRFPISLARSLLAFKSSVFLKALSNNLLLVVLSLIIQLPLALTLALVIGKTLPRRTIFRTIFFLPFILSDVVTGVIWSFIYQPGGLLNTTLRSLFPGFQPQLWLANPNIVLSSIFVVMIWSTLGSLQYFDLIWVMTGGDPVHACETMATYLMTYGFHTFSMGYGNAIGVIMFALCFVFSLMYQRFIMRGDLAGSIAERPA